MQIQYLIECTFSRFGSTEPYYCATTHDWEPLWGKSVMRWDNKEEADEFLKENIWEIGAKVVAKYSTKNALTVTLYDDGSASVYRFVNGQPKHLRSFFSETGKKTNCHASALKYAEEQRTK